MHVYMDSQTQSAILPLCGREVSIRQTLFKKLNPTVLRDYYQTIHNIYMNISDHKIGAKGILTITKGKITLKNNILYGGKEKKIEEIEGTKYEYTIDDIIPHTTTKKMISFVNIDGLNENCVVLISDNKNSGSTVILNGIMNDEDCIKCLDPTKKYKTGNILMQIVIKHVKKSGNLSHIKRIELQDTSIKRCFNIGIKLIYLKMITHGETYYSKFGFKPKKVKEDCDKNNTLLTDYKVFKYNKELFKTKRTLTNQEIGDIIKNSRINDNEILFYKEFIKPYLKKNEIIDTSIFIKSLMNLVFKEQKEEMKINDEKRKIICEFIAKIYENLYEKIGYKKYFSDIWILNL